MRKLYQRIALFIALLFLIFTNNLIAQVNSTTAISEDSITSDKDNLKLLTERVYLAFKAYRTGKYEFNKEPESDSIRALRRDSAEKEGWHIDFLLMNERIIHPVILRGEEFVSDKAYRDMNKIPADSVQSIEIMDMGTGISALHGVSSNGIVVRLKE